MTPEMGRPKTAYPNLPPRMTARTLGSGKVLFYYTGNGRKEPLGPDLNRALHRYADLETNDAPGGATFLKVSDEWEAAALHVGKGGAPRAKATQDSYRSTLIELRAAFGKALLSQIRPMHISQYLERRSSKIMANREVQVFSIIWNWCRKTGRTDDPNPALGIERNRERPREKYIDEQEYRAIWERSPSFLRDAMDLALLTSQRPSDILKMTRQDIRDSHLWLKQNKTGARIGVSIEGELKSVIDRILSADRPARSLVYLVADDKGQRVTLKRLEEAFRKARLSPDTQFRDLRAKSISDTDGLREASQRAGHANEVITASVYRRVKGLKVKPLR